MSFARNCRPQGGTFQDDYRYPFNRNNYNNNSSNNYRNRNWNSNCNPTRNFNHAHEFSGQFGEHNRGYHYAQPNCAPSLKRRKFSAATWGDSGRHYPPPNMHYTAAPSDSSNFIPPPIRSNAEASTSISSKRDRSQLEDDEPVFMSRDEIERYSPSRRDGIDALRETHLRYSYCAFIQNLGLQLELPQTTIGTAMVLCHRFFVRRSHACHDRFLIATAALFLAAKSEETPRPLNNVLRASCEIFHKQDVAFLSYLLPVDWFEQYRERVIEAEQMILTTLNFELNVQHPYAPLTSILNKLGLSQTVLVNMALNLVSEGLRSSLWLQFKPHHIAAGAAYLAAKFLNFDLASSNNIWQEFQTTPAILQDVSQQLMELF
ncbi:PREDICTED: cyclin-T1-4 isoform X1 [Theobroma cacao]|uniref:Cyclin family protein isoform 2 n=2 Tax=Theobroma cacao TaxID=3641 RepID=A0A061ETJ8_THECC|nr:PREDICTED: cyclin-T1-4 isoform X1 [Theobroma cacao]EOY05623.1 Cyclin family protein isoform 2 [Theobroma cacao]EOY05624.1 Cyclin family protein isoform 2 [Theobroma cacao]